MACRRGTATTAAVAQASAWLRSALLLTDDRGFAHAFDAKTGVCRVVKPADKFAVIATNSLGEATCASPAFSNGLVFLRTD